MMKYMKGMAIILSLAGSLVLLGCDNTTGPAGAPGAPGSTGATGAPGATSKDKEVIVKEKTVVVPAPTPPPSPTVIIQEKN